MSLLAKRRAMNYPINLVIKLDKRNRAFREVHVRKKKLDWEKTLKWLGDLILFL